MNRKLILGLGILAIPFIANADSAVFNLLNDSGSIVNPIKVTAGYISYNYYYYGTVPPGCPTGVQTVDLSTVIHLPVKVGTDTSIPVPFTPPEISKCLTDPSSAVETAMFVTEVDGKSKQSGSCNAATGFPTSVTLNIRELTNDFVCNVYYPKKK